MRVTVDTNILLRAAVHDDLAQARAAQDLMQRATLIAIPTYSLCEFVWVLERTYKLRREAIIATIEALLSAENVVFDRLLVDAGVASLREGGDFADAVIAYEGRRLGGDTFVSFDRQAVTLLQHQGLTSRLLR